MTAKSTIFLIVIIFFMILGLINKRSSLLFMCNTIIIIMYVGGYNGSGDLRFYKPLYDSQTIVWSATESLYSVIAYVFSVCGVSFYWFHFIISAISIITIAYVVAKMTKEKAFVMSLLIGFSTLEYALQIKTLCAAAIIIYALYYLFTSSETDKRKNIKYFLLIMVATGFHFSSAFFLIFLFYKYIQYKYLKYYITLGGVVLVVTHAGILNFLLRYIPELSFYIGKYRSMLTFVGTCIWQLMGFVIVYWLKLYAAKKKSSEEDMRLVNYIYLGSGLMLFVMPFYLVTTVANRLVRIWSVYYYICASIIKVPKKHINILRVLMIGYSIGSLVLFYVILGDEYNLIPEILGNNMFIGDWRE